MRSKTSYKGALHIPITITQFSYPSKEIKAQINVKAFLFPHAFALQFQLQLGLKYLRTTTLLH